MIPLRNIIKKKQIEKRENNKQKMKEENKYRKIIADDSV